MKYFSGEVCDGKGSLRAICFLSEELVEPDCSCIGKVFEADAISWCEIIVCQFMRMRYAVDVDWMGHECNIALMR